MRTGPRSAVRHRGALLAAVFLAFAAPAEAAEPGREGMLFERLAGDARSAALGASASGSAEGEGALFANPAAGLLRRDCAFGITHLSWLEGFFGETVAGQVPVGLNGTLGGSLFLFAHDALPVTTEVLPGGTGGLARIMNIQASFLGSQWMTEGLAVGADIRVLHEEAGEETSEAFAVDAGVLGMLGSDLAVGAAVRGLGKIIRSQEDLDPLPLRLNLGARYESPDWPARVYAGGTFSAFGLSAGGVGAEAGEWLGGSVRTMVQVGEDGKAGFAVGVGAHRDMWVLDYAFAPVSGLGYAHRLTLSVRFGRRKAL